MRQPNNYTHKDESRIELSTLVIVLLAIGSIPLFLLMILNNGLLVLAISFTYLVGFMDMILTADMINRGFKEQNFYRIFFSHFGNRRGFEITVVANCLVRAAVCVAFLSNPIVILMGALGSFVGPLWNTMHAFNFRDDIVLRVPTEVKVGTDKIQIDSGSKTRLEQYKDEADSQ